MKINFLLSPKIFILARHNFVSLLKVNSKAYHLIHLHATIQLTIAGKQSFSYMLSITAALNMHII